MEAERLNNLMKLKYNSKETWIRKKDEEREVVKCRIRNTRVWGKDREIQKGGNGIETRSSRKRDGICFVGKEFDSVRSRHSTREGGGTSARWRWRVACLAPGCPRGGASYDKADRLIHHLSRQQTCANFWREKIGDRLDMLFNQKIN